MENITKQTESPCSGCGACAAACPKQAIRLEPDGAGFLRARADASRCVDCGLCVKICPRFQDAAIGAALREAKLYAVQSADYKTLRRCSSGGLAHELALAAVRSGGRAVGAVYDTETDRVRHVVVNREAGIAQLDGSKYLQSDPGEAFAEAISLARQNAEARFAVFGTPCQIAGLAKLCQQYGVRERFLLVEIFCHGVPSYKLWEYQLERMRKKLHTDHFDSVQFRYKKDDWHSYCLRAEAAGRVFLGSREREPFWQVFFENVLLGDACMRCRLRKENSLSDLRIGDYWGRRFQSRSDGVSAAFACTERGIAAVEALLAAGRLTALEAGSPEEMLSAQNMEGYQEQALQAECMAMLQAGRPLRAVISHYRRRQPLPRRVKRLALGASAVLPDGIRAKLKKRYSSHQLRGR